MDAGFGSALAPKGSVEWAKRWRVEFQTAVKQLPDAPQSSLRFYKVGLEFRAWTLLTNEKGEPFPDFDVFCAARRPHGLQTDPKKFRDYLRAELGERDADLVTVSPGDDKGGAPEGNRNAARDRGEETTSDTMSEVVSGAERRKAERLRAILRAPELVQQLYREGRITQTVAAKLGPKSPTPEKASRIAEARQGLEQLDRALPPREFRKRAKAVVNEALAVKEKTALDALRLAWKRASREERDAFLTEVGSEGW